MDVSLLVRLLAVGVMIMGLFLMALTLTHLARPQDVRRLWILGTVVFGVGVVGTFAGYSSRRWRQPLTRGRASGAGPGLLEQSRPGLLSAAILKFTFWAFPRLMQSRSI